MKASDTPMGSTMDLEVRHCRVLVAVRDTGGVVAAARALGVAQSTVSETLLALERLLGTPVTVRRSGQGATLTPTAEALLPHARALIQASEAALASVAQQRQGAIRLGAVESISSFLLPEPLSAFRLLWPHIDVRIAIGLCRDLRERVVRAELDAALTIEGGTPSPSGDATAVWPARLRFVVSPGRPLTQGAVRRRDLETRTFLLADAEGAFNDLLKAWAGAAGSGLRLESAGSIDGVKRGVMNSDAIGVLPDYAVAGELAAHTLIALNIDDTPPPVSLRLTTLRPPQPGSPLESLIGQIRGAIPSKMQPNVC